MEDVEVGHCGGDAVELVHQRRLDVVEKLGAHKARRFGASPFDELQKKSANFCLDRGSRLPIPKTRKLTDITVSISAFSSGITEIVEISVHLKSKNASNLCIYIYSICLYRCVFD